VTITNQQTKQELDQNKNTFVVTFVALGSLGALCCEDNRNFMITLDYF
jgi:hypothetical protein